MKISTTITKEEKNNTDNSILKDPCAYIECGDIDCDVCPLHEAAVALRKAQENFCKVLYSIEEEK